MCVCASDDLAGLSQLAREGHRVSRLGGRRAREQADRIADDVLPWQWVLLCRAMLRRRAEATKQTREVRHPEGLCVRLVRRSRRALTPPTVFCQAVCCCLMHTCAPAPTQGRRQPTCNCPSSSLTWMAVRSLRGDQGGPGMTGLPGLGCPKHSRAHESRVMRAPTTEARRLCKFAR